MEGETSQEKEKEKDFFECSICLDSVTDPVVTPCGHLFCWPCLHPWLFPRGRGRDSDATECPGATECPVCKGEITVKTLTPICGRSENNSNAGGPKQKKLTRKNKIPPRPQARRVENQRDVSTLSMEEILQQRTTARTTSLLSMFLTSRGMRGEQNDDDGDEEGDEVVGLEQNNVNASETEDVEAYLVSNEEEEEEEDGEEGGDRDSGIEAETSAEI